MNSSHSQIAELLAGYRFNFASERQLQDGIEGVLAQHSLDFEREVRLGPHERIDFMVDDVGVEVKVAGSSVDLLRQLARYAEHDRVSSLIVVTNASRLACVEQAEFGEKRVSVVVTSRRVF